MPLTASVTDYRLAKATAFHIKNIGLQIRAIKNYRCAGIKCNTDTALT